MTTATLTRPVPGGILRLAGSAVAAIALLWMAASAHLHYACAVNDTPYLRICPEPTPDQVVQEAELRDRLHRNPGDAWAWVRLLPVSGESARDNVLRGAEALAPNHTTVLRWRAAKALETNELQQGVALLVQMLEHRNSREAAEALAQVVASADGLALLQPHLKPSNRWLPRVLETMRASNMPPVAALPLVGEATRQDALKPQTRRFYLRWLKREGELADAYGLWLALHRREVPLLYNGSFDQPLVPDGFDWEHAAGTRSAAGVLVGQEPVAKRGMVLSIEFTGRKFSPAVVRQYVFTPPGSYLLEGQYMASKLRSEGGLTWRVVCPGTRTALEVESEPLQDSGGFWRTIAFTFDVPPECGPVASLQLEPVNRYEASAGMKGRVELDGLTLTRLSN